MPSPGRVIFLVLLSLLWFITPASAQQTRVLEQGQSVSAEFNKVQEGAALPDHIYTFSAPKGDYVEVLAKQEGCDIKLQIIAPDNSTVAISDSFNGGYGPECWRGVLTQTGEYKVCIKYVSTRGINPKYSIALQEKRKATSDDEQRARAQQLYLQAMRLRQSGTQRDSEQAYFIYEKAAELYRGLGDILGEAQSLESAAALGTPALTRSLRVELYQSALFLFRRLRERSGEAMALHNLGTIYAEMRRPREAISFYEQALIAHHSIGDLRSEAIALNNLALVYCGLQQHQEALHYYQKALATCRQAGDRTSEASLLEYIGNLYEELGQKKEAERYYQQSQAMKK
jgi:tetratricopeptide (TPR) repeat protein